MRYQFITFYVFIIFQLSSSHLVASCYWDEVQNIEFEASSTSYSVYENEYITICLEEINQQPVDDFEGKSISLQILDSWENFNTPVQKISISRDGNCFHFKARNSDSQTDKTYTARLHSDNGDISFTETDISIHVKKTNGNNQKLNKKHLYIKGVDSSIDSEGTDKIILGNTVPISPFTSFSISSQQIDSSSFGYSASYNFMYTGDHDIEDNGIFCILISDNGYQAFGDIPDVSISYNGSDFTPFFSITNALPSPTSTSFVPSDQPNIISINQGSYFENSIGEIDFLGNSISGFGVNVGNGSPSGNPNLNPGVNFDPTGEFNAIFVCDGQLYFCDLEDLFSNPAFWTFDNGGDGRDDFDEDTCIDFCSIIDNDCSAIGYGIIVQECEIIFSLEDCTILSDSDIKIYYKDSGDCAIPVGYSEIINPYFTTIKTSPTDIDIIFPLTYGVGCYQIEVLCDECLSPIIKEIKVYECCPFAYEIDQNIASCLSDGYIDIVITGVGTPPFTYLWSNGQSTEDITQLDEGGYSLTVTDFYDCAYIIDSYLESCCCLYTLDFGGPGLEISDIYTNDQWLSETNQFSFPYDNNGETSSSANLIDLANDLNNFENAQGGSAYEQSGVIYVESCNNYDYLIGNNFLGKNDDCENTDVTTIVNDCDYVVDYECNLMIDLLSNGDCSLSIIIENNTNYLVTLEYMAPYTNIWTPVVSNLSYSTNIGYATTGIYRLVGIGVGVCKDVLACELEHICCECEIIGVELLGDYLEDEELCLGIDSLGFRITTQNCLNNTSVELTYPDGNIVSMVEVSADVYEFMISTEPSEIDNGLYLFHAEDSYSCFDVEEYEVEIENCDLCANCELLLPVTSISPGKINIYELSVSCGLIDSFEISWYLNEVSELSILFKTGTSDDVFSHPLYNFPIQGGNIIPVLDWISINGAYYNDVYPGIGNCLDSVIVETPGCGDQYSANYNYSIGGFLDRVIEYEISGTSNFINTSFKGFHVNDTIKITNNSEVLFFAAIGSDVGTNDYTSIPNQISTKDPVPYIIDINDLNLQVDSILKIEIFANKTQSSTKWNFNIECIDDYECGELGEPDYGNITCNFDSINCKYLFNLPHIGTIYPQYLPHNYTYKLKTNFKVSKSICSFSTEYFYTSADYCDLDSISINADEVLGTYALSFHGYEGFYDEAKNELISHLSINAADCDYTGNIGYYQKLYINLTSGFDCIEDDDGDGPGNDYGLNFYIHPCIDNITFLDNEKQIIFNKTQIFNYQSNECDECKSYINNNYLLSVNALVNEEIKNIDKYFYKLKFVNNGFEYLPLESLDNYDPLSRYIYYYNYADELCQSDSCKVQRYELIIDDLDDGCNNFSIFVDSNPCDNNYEFDSLAYQISNGVETFSSNMDLIEFLSENTLTSIIENSTVYASDAKVYPNPAYNSIHLEYTSDFPSNIEVEIYDRAMKRISNFPWQVSRGITHRPLDITDLHDGLYIIRFKEDEKSIYKKFIVINK